MKNAYEYASQPSNASGQYNYLTTQTFKLSVCVITGYVSSLRIQSLFTSESLVARMFLQTCKLDPGCVQFDSD